MNIAVSTLLEQTKSGHGFWLTNHQELIEDQVASLINIHGEKTTLELINNRESNAHKSIYAVIEYIRDAVHEAEHNTKHEDDYFNAGGFFAHWEQYSQAEKLELISKALGKVK